MFGPRKYQETWEAQPGAIPFRRLTRTSCNEAISQDILRRGASTPHSLCLGRAWLKPEPGAAAQPGKHAPVLPEPEHTGDSPLQNLCLGVEPALH